MLYRQDLATRCDAAFSRTAARAPLLTYRVGEFQSDRDIRTTHNRPARGDGRSFRAKPRLFGPAACEGAKSSDMVAVQPAGPARKILRPARSEKGG
jgi:hypothetical protein